MSEATESSLFHKLRYTPIGDLLCLRLTSRLDWKASIDRADLPAPAKDLLHRVVHQTRLWRSEKADVASELVAHFTDGIESGESYEDLIHHFGDERASAKLIRRGKKRNRPLAWHAFSWLRWGLVGLVVLYLGLGIYFVMGRPSVTVNYIAVLNERTQQSPVSDRAWPHYRQALLATPWRQNDDALRNAIDRGPDGKHWDLARNWIDANQAIVGHIREGADKPILGFRLGNDGDAYDAQLYPERCKPAPANAPLHDALLANLILPHLGELRFLARVLGADARVARETGDAKRFVSDVESMLSLASQSTEDRTLVSCLVGTGIRALALHHVEEALLHSPKLLDDAQLQSLAHRLTLPRMAADLMTFDTERMFFYDLVQRMYTDDGNGDGRLALDGVRALPSISSPEQRDTFHTAGAVTLGPAAMLAMASRRELVDEYNRMIDAHEANLHRPPWQGDWTSAEVRIMQIKSSARLSMKFALIAIIMPALNSVQWNAERVIAREDALATAIALELHRRRAGRYPESLAELSPGMLPTIPADRMTGAPIRYAVRDGNPILYSVGADRDDDGGKIAYQSNGKIDRNVSRWTGKTVDGDWLLYPEPKDPPEDEE